MSFAIGLSPDKASVAETWNVTVTPVKPSKTSGIIEVKSKLQNISNRTEIIVEDAILFCRIITESFISKTLIDKYKIIENIFEDKNMIKLSSKNLERIKPDDNKESFHDFYKKLIEICENNSMSNSQIKILIRNLLETSMSLHNIDAKENNSLELTLLNNFGVEL